MNPRVSQFSGVCRRSVGRGDTPVTSKAHEYALGKLTEAGANVKLEVGVTAVHPDRVEFDDNTTIPARTVVWGGGESGSARQSATDDHHPLRRRWQP
jgi:NADH dehydrogenase FAD-containing subunit